MAKKEDDNYETFEKECKNNTNITNPELVQWILVSNVGALQDKNIDVLKNVSDYTRS